MTPRTFEDWLRLAVEGGQRYVAVDVTELGVALISVKLEDEAPKLFRVQESRVEPATFDSPSQGGAS